MSNIVKQNHFETSDGDTLIVTVKACPLESDFDEGVLRDMGNGQVTPCCKNDGAMCSNFYKIWEHDGRMWLQCSALSEHQENAGSPTPIEINEYGVVLNNTTPLEQVAHIVNTAIQDIGNVEDLTADMVAVGKTIIDTGFDDLMNAFNNVE